MEFSANPMPADYELKGPRCWSSQFKHSPRKFRKSPHSCFVSEPLKPNKHPGFSVCVRTAISKSSPAGTTEKAIETWSLHKGVKQYSGPKNVPLDIYSHTGIYRQRDPNFPTADVFNASRPEFALRAITDLALRGEILRAKYL
jgi:hypothetical protein